ncbi:MAG: PTS glucose transporter subunit IIA [Roseburia sp.]|nr:PTS glucose transporter subunit IIA [Roseburia sp.]MCM1098729.1 PTS glucose transporter subunit IIA [Ruminococcus flavefaciens]
MSIVWLAAVITAMFFGFCAGRMTLAESGAEEILQETGESGGKAAGRFGKGRLLSEGRYEADEAEKTAERGRRKGVLLFKDQYNTAERAGSVLEEDSDGYGEIAEPGNGAGQDERIGQPGMGRDRRGGQSGLGRERRPGQPDLERDRRVGRIDSARNRKSGGNGRGRESGRTGALRSREIAEGPRGLAGAVGSPVSGEIEDLWKDGSRAVVIRPEEDKLYAPTGGKILKLFPLGNAFLFRTELGAELYIQAGEGEDELLGRYYRPRVVRNEIVGKGKLLLEFDRQGLKAQGIFPRVFVTVENSLYGSEVMAEQGERIRAGEEILRIGQPEGEQG